jgi:hypothetical protein
MASPVRRTASRATGRAIDRPRRAVAGGGAAVGDPVLSRDGAGTSGRSSRRRIDRAGDREGSDGASGWCAAARRSVGLGEAAPAADGGGSSGRWGGGGAGHRGACLRRGGGRVRLGLRIAVLGGWAPLGGYRGESANASSIRCGSHQWNASARRSGDERASGRGQAPTSGDNCVPASSPHRIIARLIMRTRCWGGPRAPARSDPPRLPATVATAVPRARALVAKLWGTGPHLGG